jgi:hypothetical protein
MNEYDMLAADRQRIHDFQERNYRRQEVEALNKIADNSGRSGGGAGGVIPVLILLGYGVYWVGSQIWEHLTHLFKHDHAH